MRQSSFIKFATIGSLLFCVAHAQPAQSAEMFPYVAYVATEGTSLASGPGFKYYSTDRLKWGTKVEVYQHEDDWAAIRPPEGSFSWVPASAVDSTDNPVVVRVKTAGTRPRIGTRYSTKRDVESVAMRQGERLEVLGQQEFTSGSGKLSKWYKVSPPPGEFRWIRAGAIQNSPPIKQTPESALKSEGEAEPAFARASDPIQPAFQATESSSSSKVVTAAYEVSAELQPDDLVLPGRISQVANPDLYGQVSGITTVMPIDRSKPATTHIPASDAISPNSNGGNVQLAQWSYDLAPRTSQDMFSRTAQQSQSIQQRPQKPLPGSPWREVDGFSSVRQVANNVALPSAGDRVAAAPALSQPTRSSNATRVSATSPVKIAAIPPCGPARTQLWLMQQELMDIDLRLAQTVTQPPAGWSLSMLRARSQAVIDSSQVAAVRDEAQRVLAKIAQFEDVQRRTRRVDYSSTSLAAMMPPGGVLPTSSAAGSWLANVPMEYGNEYSSYAASDPGFDGLAGYGGYSSGGYSSGGYVPSPGETIIGDRRVDDDYEASPQLASQPTPATRTTAASKNNYDGTGWLMPVVTDRDDMPRYVLTDSDGNVKQFVSPQPGLNIQRYLRQKIAIYGQERFLDDLKRPHLTAERVISLDTKTR